MKKSDMYYLAMESVVDNSSLSKSLRIEIIEVLMDDRRTSLWEERKNEDDRT